MTVPITTATSVVAISRVRRLKRQRIQRQLQAYYDEWRQRPVAKEFAVAQITIDVDLHLQINLDLHGLIQLGERVCLPIDELLGYIVDRHFADPEKRRELHTAIRETRQQWAELGRDYEVTIGRVGRLSLTYKNPACRTEMETQHQAVENQKIICPPTDVTCPACGSTHRYEGRDLHFGPTA